MTDHGNSRKRLGDFEIVRELGRGGMGIVYEARQVSLNRKVALKVISGSLGLSSKAVLRFQREAEAAGKLHHTNIVPIYSTGEDDGAHFYAMELIDGPSLHQVIRNLNRADGSKPAVSDSAATMAVGAAPPQEDVLLDSDGAFEAPAWVSEILGAAPAAESTPAPGTLGGPGSTSSRSSSGYFDTVATMIAGVADGLDHAHEHGVIHRDIKPANLLLSRDGRVSINDFGLARMLEQPGMTLSGEFVGSPLYMSPEQITAGRAPLDHRTDIYSLGATLYELLTLRPVFPGRSRDEVIAQILHKELVSPRRHNPRLPVDLETICLKALEKDPDRRYQTAGQLAEDLRRFVDRRAISARRIGPLERSVRWARKNKALTAMACLTLAIAVCATSYIYLLDRAHRREQAQQDALFAAMSGRPVQAGEAIQKAGMLGAKTSWVNMLRGQVDMFEGRSRDALSQFEAAASRAPGSVMAQAMLTEAYMANGLWDEYATAIEELDRLAANQGELSAEDLLFRGIALVSMAPEQALLAIDEATRKRPSFILAKVWRAHVKSVLAQTRGDTELVLDALADFAGLSQVDGDFETNPFFNDARLNARLGAHRLYLRGGDRAEAEGYLLKAASDVGRLADSPDFQVGNWRRLLYYELTKDLDGMRRVIRDVASSQSIGFAVTPFAAGYFGFGRHRIEEALRQIQALGDPEDPFVVWARTILLSESPETRAAADRFLDRYLVNYPRDSEAIEDVFTVLLLRGQREDAVDYVRERARSLESKKSTYLPISRASLDYLSLGETTSHDLLRRFGDSELRRPHVHFAIGLRQLTEGHREAARKSFEESGNSPFYLHTMSTWARAFAARMKDDESWPDWLPATPVSSGAK